MRPPRYVPPLGCEFCAYEAESAAPTVILVTVATTTIQTPKGPRHVCARHAVVGTWERRKQRVSRVA